MNISIILNNIQDPRRNHLQKHSLETIIYITLAAVIGGAESWYEIEEFDNTHIDFFKSKIGGLEEIPSHDTFNRVFSIIKPKEFESGFRQWDKNCTEHIRALSPLMARKCVVQNQKTRMERFVQ